MFTEPVQNDGGVDIKFLSLINVRKIEELKAMQTEEIRELFDKTIISACWIKLFRTYFKKYEQEWRPISLKVLDFIAKSLTDCRSTLTVENVICQVTLPQDKTLGQKEDPFIVNLKNLL